MIVMIVDSEVLGEKGIFEEEVGLEVEEGRGIVLQFPEEVVAACLLGFSCVLQG